MQRAQAYFGLKRGGSGARTVDTIEEAEKILRGGYGVTRVTLRNEQDQIIGEREKREGKWFWWLDAEDFQ